MTEFDGISDCDELRAEPILLFSTYFSFQQFFLLTILLYTLLII